MTQLRHLAGRTWHGRRGGPGNAFSYGVDYLLLDAEGEGAGPWPFRRNRGGIVALHDSDHGGADSDGRGAAWVRDVLACELPNLAPARIELLAQPRIFGHVFNPVAFWIARDDANGVRAVLAEVTNTYGDRHFYLCARSDLAVIGPRDRIAARKVFHVSPFQPIAGDYEFVFDIAEDRLAIRIALGHEAGGLIATLAGRLEPATTRGLLAAMIRRPLGSRRVLALIHWQAVKLWWKGATFRSRPEPPAEELTR